MAAYLADAILAQAAGTGYRYRDSATINPGVPNPGTVLYGANDAFFSTLNAFSAISNAGGMKVIRRYEGNFPSTPSAHQTSDYAANLVPYISFSGPSIATILSGSQDATIGSYFANCSATKQALITYLHEVDNGKLGGASITDFKNAIAHIHDLKNAHAPNPAKVLFGPTFMGYAFTMAQAPSGAGYYAAWMPSTSSMDFVGADPYRYWRPPHSPDLTTVPPPDPKIGGLGTKRTMAYLMSGWETYHAANPSMPLVIGEYAAHPDPANTTDRALWLQQSHQWFLDHNCIAACYFHFGTAGSSESGPWYLDCFHNFTTPDDHSHSDPNSINAFAALLAGG